MTLKTTGAGLELNGISHVDDAREEIGGREVSQTHSIHSANSL